MEKCLKCGSEFLPTPGAGRPRVYCSTACRRLAELEIRRLNRRLESLEEAMSHARIAPAGEIYGESEAERDARVARVAAEIDSTERRLRALLAGDDQ